MLYYLVALLDKESYKSIENIQKYLSNKYDLYDELPILHLTLEIIEDPNINNLCTSINNILKSYSKFNIEINGTICFDTPFKSVNLKVEKKDIIIKLIQEINLTLKKQGFKVRNCIKNWDLHISLANPKFYMRNWCEKEFKQASLIINNYKFYKIGKIEKIQLWKPINNKKEMILKSFPL